MHADLRAHEDFDAFVRALEIRAGARLNEPARSQCAAAYCTHPTGVARAAEAALERAQRSAVGLFIRMVADGDHELLETTEALTNRGVEHAKAENRGARYTWPTCRGCDALFQRDGLSEDMCPDCRPNDDELLVPNQAPAQALDPGTIADPEIRRVVEAHLARTAA